MRCTCFEDLHCDFQWYLILTCHACVFISGKSASPFHWTVNHCVVPPGDLLRMQTCSRKRGRRRTTCKYF